MMKINRTVAAGSAIALALAWASAPLAQPAPSDFTAENVAADAPFGDLPIDVATINVDDIEGYLATLMQTMTPEQQTELQQRCVIISANADAYATAAVTLCDSLLATVNTDGGM
jgi:hypothetical protein